MVPAISKLHPPPDSHRHPALALRLNPEVLQQLRRLRQTHKKPKLVVKDGKFSIKISDSLVFPCTMSPETLRLDVYSPARAPAESGGGESVYDFTGTVMSRLNIISDPKQIKEHMRILQLAESSGLPPPPPAAKAPGLAGNEAAPRVTSVDSKAYVISAADADADKIAKFIAYVALGPMTREDIERRLQLAAHLRAVEIDHLFATHTQSYLRKDTFTESDIYPLLAQRQPVAINPQKSYVILKDKAYKELRPWQWLAYTEFERQLIITNINHALSRQGFSDTHPLRRRIVERTSPVRKPTSAASLGGGLLVSSTKKASTPHVPDLDSSISRSPVFSASLGARASTESPKMNSEARKRFTDKGKRTIGSPLRHEEAQARGRVSSLALSSSSEDEKHVRKHSMATREKRYSNSSSQSNSSMNSNTNSYTSPSSVNEEMHSDPSDHESKAAATTKPAALAASLPTRPSSSFTNHEKKQQYYAQLAEKFRSRYKEYEQLHHQLSKDPRRNSHIEKKKKLTKLFEMHNTLSEWKRRLWDYHNENNMAVGVMHLSKHRKSNSMSRVSSSAPSTSKVASTDRFPGPNGNTALRHTDSHRKQPFADRSVPQRPKFALDY